MKKEQYEQELKASMLDLRNAWIRCSYIFGNIYYDCNDYITDNYPFDKSFDDIDTINWIDKVIDNIEKSQNKEIANVFKVEKEKTIPVMDEEISFSLDKGTVLFDEEIVINTDGIYDNNRLRLIIHKEVDTIDVFISAYEGKAGRCYRNFLITEEEYSKYSDIQEFVKKVLIDGEYDDLGISVATGLDKNNDYIDCDIGY